MTEDLKRFISNLPEFILPDETAVSILGGQESPDLLDIGCVTIDGVICGSMNNRCTTNRECGDNYKCFVDYFDCHINHRSVQIVCPPSKS